ncbi:succinate dehydrogenase cytochrome b560 subunit [Hypoxylon trugodes]|uniref:succinate dehydrogenase cytochrome b560 subunit n=1 Tax=Hypoxylon trugodes TaxID=326681 RepID=UPI0021A193A1|nr:succinate dehydrogenase cytochrome b560 subunit [Hypoxylon trugodes]KAI1391618.1 succinate dehydrogenase cytochrome b560 subunit [Hypoxylon trugodes]
MIAQRVGIRALRQAAVKQPNALFLTQNLPRLALASNVTSLQISRSAATTKLSETDAQSLLASQRRHRPVSPHLTAYDYTQTWFGASIWTRITGQALSTSLYAFSLAYLVAPLTGWHIESASLAEAFATLPPIVKTGFKLVASWPFFFHFANGIRHLTWDLTYGFKKGIINQTSYVVLGTSLVGALGATFLL